MKNIIFKGAATALVTPFINDNVNFNELKNLIEFQLNNEIDALVVCGTTGESSTMSLQEKKETIEFTVKTVNKRVPVIAGTGTNCTKTTIELSKQAENLGADALLIVTPYYNKTTQEGLIAHYTKIAEATTLPIILYNVPSRTGLNIEPETCLKLSKIKNIVAIKEASGNISQVAKIASLCKNDLHIYSGNDDQILPILSLGGLGVISVFSNIEPKLTHDMIYKYLNGDIETATYIQLKYLKLINTLFCEVNPIPIKYALNKRGFNVGVPRFPLVELTEKNKYILNALL